MSRIYHFLIRVSAFLGKEIFIILRQPLLVLTLVLGPFLILLLFGIGFRNEAPALRTLFVVPEAESEFTKDIETQVSSLGPHLIFAGVVQDRAEATERLRRGEVDVVAVIPPGVEESIRNSQQVVIELDHYQIDPFQIDYVKIFGQVYVDEINRRVLRAVASQGQQEAGSIHDSLSTTRKTVTALREALTRGDQAAADQHQQDLEREVDALSLLVGATMGLTQDVQQQMENGSNSNNQAISDLLTSLREDTNSLNGAEDPPNRQSQEEKVEKIETELSQLETLLNEFQSIDAQVLISPFRSETKSIATVDIQPSDFYAPAVIALLMQHLGVTFAALSIVQERREGMMELLRVSPVSAYEMLLGKYLSYLLFAGILGAILTLAVIYGLGVPMLGDWRTYSLVLGLLILASLGIGFVISLVARSDSEAVQYSMIVLLTSVFFSGAFVRLQALWEPVHVVSWAMPATYGILLLQNIMLRGFLPNFVLLIGLAAIGIGLFLIAWLLLRRHMAHS